MIAIFLLVVDSCVTCQQLPINYYIIGDDHFCETGVPPGQPWIDDSRFFADDLLWDSQGCGPTSTCCTFNNPPLF